MAEQGMLNVLITFIFLMLLFYLNREIEIWRLINEIEMYLRSFKMSRDKALDATLKAFREKIGSSGDNARSIEERVNAFINTAYIPPVDLDPYGIVPKIKHIQLTADETLKKEILRFNPSLDHVDVNNLLNLVSATRALNEIYKQVDHLYRVGRKFKSLWVLMQLDALLPFITEYIKALEAAVKAFSNGWPVGDSIGPLVAARLIHEYGTLEGVKEPVEDTIVSELTLDGKKVLVVKAKGPGGTVGRLDDAIEWIINEYGKISLLITVDAALKLESEESGTVCEGFGVAMGGTGVERFGIESIATKYKIPLYAVLIKMSEIEALSVMTEKLFKAVDNAYKTVLRFIKERTDSNGVIVVVGVGNTVGIYP